MHSHDSRAWQRPGDSAPSSRPASARLVDPEDDLPSATYGGDFETTTIPHYNSDDSGRSGLSLLAEPEPLPYLDPGTSSRHDVLPGTVDYDDEVDERVAAANRRGTQDLGLLLLRASVGAILIAHGLAKAFGLWGGQGLDGFRNSLADMGYEHAGLLTYLAAGTQISAGVLLVLGLFTPPGRSGRAGIPDQRAGCQRRGRIRRGLHRVLSSRRQRVPASADRGGGLDHSRRAGPLRPGRGPRLGAAAVPRLLRGAAARYRRGGRRLHAAQRRQSAQLTGHRSAETVFRQAVTRLFPANLLPRAYMGWAPGRR